MSTTDTTIAPHLYQVWDWDWKASGFAALAQVERAGGYLEQLYPDREIHVTWLDTENDAYGVALSSAPIPVLFSEVRDEATQAYLAAHPELDEVEAGERVTQDLDERGVDVPEDFRTPRSSSTSIQLRALVAEYAPEMQRTLWMMGAAKPELPVHTFQPHIVSYAQWEWNESGLQAWRDTEAVCNFLAAADQPWYVYLPETGQPYSALIVSTEPLPETGTDLEIIFAGTDVEEGYDEADGDDLLSRWPVVPAGWTSGANRTVTHRIMTLLQQHMASMDVERFSA